MSDFRSSRTNHKGSQASPKHLSSGQNVAHSPKGWGMCVCGGGGGRGTEMTWLKLKFVTPTSLRGPEGGSHWNSEE